MRKKKVRIFASVLLVLAAGALCFGLAGWQYRKAHVFVGEAVYDRDARFLDLRGQDISAAHFDALQAELPLCDILWDVPFQGTSVPSDCETISLTSLTMEDVETLDYLTGLRSVDARECADYGALAALEARRPEVAVDYAITLGGRTYERDTASLAFDEADGAELLEKLQYLPDLQTVDFGQTRMPVSELLALWAAYPDISFTWEKTVLGQSYPNTVTELDFSGTPLTGVAELEEEMAYFPNLQKLILCDTGIDDETMAAYRDRVREDYKVVWRVRLGRLDIRTDATTFMPYKEGIAIQDNETENLKFCEDMLVVDLGHKRIKKLDWLYGMPHLQFLVLADTQVSDLTPVGALKELIYLELFKSPQITDYGPLVGCTALQDLNVACTNGDAAVFADMPWLNNLWINQTGVTPETRALLTQKLPDTHIEFDNGWHMGGGWRDLDNYYVMRDLLEMPYYNWGATKYEVGKGPGSNQ